MNLYLDVCCLCRPFDDQRDPRIKLESTAVQEILRLCTDTCTLISSEAIIEEISAIQDTTKRMRVEKVLSLAKKEIVLNDGIVARMHELIKMGGTAMDSLHIACAEYTGALLLTTDDDLITFYKSCNCIHIRIENPVIWLKERSP
jgi:predicted nucleic acid-binding protein